MENIIELKSEFIPTPVSMLYARILMVIFIGVLRDKGQSARQAEVSIPEYKEALRALGLPIPSEKNMDIAERLRAEIEEGLNTAIFKTPDGKSITIKLTEGVLCSVKGGVWSLKGVFTEKARDYIFNNNVICKEDYDVFPTIQRGDNEIGTILTARIPEDKLKIIIAEEERDVSLDDGNWTAYEKKGNNQSNNKMYI